MRRPWRSHGRLPKRRHRCHAEKNPPRLVGGSTSVPGAVIPINASAGASARTPKDANASATASKGPVSLAVAAALRVGPISPAGAVPASASACASACIVPDASASATASNQPASTACGAPCAAPGAPSDAPPRFTTDASP